MCRILIISLVLFCSVSASALSEQKPDSLKNLLHSASTPVENRVVVYAEIAEYYLRNNIDSARYYSESGLEISQTNNHIVGIFSNSCTLAKVYMTSDSLEKAAMILEDARKHLDELDDKRNSLCLFLLLGYVYDVQSDYYPAHKALYTGLKIAEDQNDSAFLWSYYNNLGIHHQNLSDHDRSIAFFKKAIEIFHSLKEDQRRYSLASSYNNLGTAYLELGQVDSAQAYFEKAIMMPDVKGNHYGMFLMLSNLGEVNMMKGNLEEALEYYEQAGRELDSLKGRFKGTTAPLYATHYRSLGNVFLETGDLPGARDYFEMALENAENIDDLTVKADAYEGLSVISEMLNENKKAIAYLKQYQAVNDSLDARRTDNKIIQLSLEYKYEKDLLASQKEMEVQKMNHKRRELAYLFAIITAGGIMISLLLLFLLQRNKARRKHLEEKTVRLEKEKIAEQLDYKNKELATNVMYLLKKNEFISSISEKLQQIPDNLKDDDSMALRDIINQLDKMVADDAWEEFEVRFKDVHSDFYHKLSVEFPSLTAQELRLCAFLRLNMTNKEIAAITYQSPESLKTARYRLRKKLGIERDENLVAFLTRI